MRILLDTNILIYREHHWNIPPNLQKLNEITQKHTIQILIHPSSYDDFNNYKNHKRKDIMLTKLNCYAKLETPPNPDKDSCPGQAFL